MLPAIFGRYTLIEPIGGGGMATVYRASLSGVGGFEKEVAVKVIRHELAEDPQFTQMFLDEARLSARLNHANIVQTFDFGQEDGLHFLAMELVHGRTLAALLKICRAKGVRLGLGPSLRVAAEVARALDYAHRLVDLDGRSLRIVHRDVSPQNVLVSREGDVKLADFGIAKAVMRSHVTQPGRVRGKCAYMAPEQIRGDDLDGRADVFSLGVLLWESLSGRSLFEGASDAAVLHQVLEKEILPPSWFAAEVPPEVDEVVMGLLAREVDARPDSAQAARSLSELIWKLIRSETEVDLSELQRRLGSGTAVHEAGPALARASRRASLRESSSGQLDPAQLTTRRELGWRTQTTPVSPTAPAGSQVAEGASEPHHPRRSSEATASLPSAPPIDLDAETVAPELRPPKTSAPISGATTAPVRKRQAAPGRRWVGAAIAAAAIGVVAGKALDGWGADRVAAIAARSPEAEEGAGDQPQREQPEEGETLPELASAGLPPAGKEGAEQRSLEIDAALGEGRGPLLWGADEEESDVIQAAEPGAGGGEGAYMGVLLWGGATPEPPAKVLQPPPQRRARQRAAPPRRQEAPLRAPSQGSVAAAPSERRAQPRVEEASPSTKLTPGELAISSMLEGETLVSIDGVQARTLGRRSPAKLTLSAGRHRVAFHHEETGMYCGVIAEIEPGKMLALNADANGVGVLKGSVRTPIPCTERR